MSSAMEMLPPYLVVCFTSLIVTLLAMLTLSEHTCQRTSPDSCKLSIKSWYKHDNEEVFELRCPAFTADYYYYRSLSVHCTTSNVSDYSELNGMCFPDSINDITFRHCPLPAMSLGQIMQNMGVSGVLNVEVESEFATTVTAEFFNGLSNVYGLALRTNGTARLHQDVFLHIPQLKNIQLHYDNIVLPKNIFRSVPNLQSLNLTSNNLTVLEANTFYNLSQVKFLNMRGNTPNLSRAVMSDLPSLEELEISSNKMTEIPQDLFLDLKALRRTIFINNDLLALPENLFKNNRNLTDFILRDNKRTINTLPTRLLAKLYKLQVVRVNNCDMSNLPENLLRHSKSVLRISLSKNAFITLPEQLLKDCVKLEDVDLSFNRIEHLPIRLFRNTRNLRSLDLSNNLLTVLKG